MRRNPDIYAVIALAVIALHAWGGSPLFPFHPPVMVFHGFEAGTPARLCERLDTVSERLSQRLEERLHSLGERIAGKLERLGRVLE